jgi:hypothetical protein
MLLSEFINLKEKPGCNMTESGRACAVHGLNECPGYKMIEDSAREKLHKRHQELRKKSGLPDPEYYKELKASYDLPDQERLARVKEIKKKYNVNEGGPFSYGAKKPRKGSVADLAAKKRQEQERSRQPIEPKDQRVGVAKVVKELDVKGASAGDDAAYNQYAQTRAFGDRMDREASATPNPSSFALSTQAGWDNQDLQPKTQHYQSPLSKELIAAQTTGLAAQNPEMEKRYTMNKLATKPKMTSAEFAAQLESQGVAEGSDNITAVFSGYGNYMSGRGANVFKHYGITVLDKQYFEDEDIAEYTVSGSKEALDQARAYLERSDQFGGMIIKQGVAEGVTSPEIKQAYDAIMKTAPKSPERKRAIKHYQQLRDDALDKKKEQGVAEGRGNIEALRTELMGEYLNIYYNALDGWNMTDHIINLQDVYGRVKRSRDPVLQQTYNLLMDHAEESIDVQASAALKAIRILGDEPNYTPPPRPPMSPEDSARADAFVNQFLAALVSHGIKTHPDWQKNNDKGVAEGRKPDYNFDIEDLKKLEQVRDLETLKTLALQLISKPSAKPMKPEKVEWFKSALERMDSPLKVIKLMYDLLLSGEGHSVIGSRKSMNPNTYRQRFGEDQVTNEDVEKYLEEMRRAGYEVLHEESHSCPECGGPAFSDQLLAEKKDACYSKVKSRYKVWPSAYASGALVRCRKVGAKNWGNKSKK